MTKSKLLDNPLALCNIMRRIALEAGEITLKYFDEAGYHGADEKADGSPVTLADSEAEILIRAHLLDTLPDIIFVGEEMAAAGERPDLSAQEYFWMVDPLDGTKEFISGSGDYTVNIALIKNGEPFIGVVYAPAKGELYAGYGAGHALMWREECNTEKTIHVRTPPKEGITVIASKTHGNPIKLDSFLEGFKVAKVLKRGSSLKICAIAAGKADLYPRLGPTCEWDTAAADAVLRSAGGMITDTKGQPLRYGGLDPKFLNPEFIASGFDWHLEE
jgi:3'(2'), 5'-bisphosphate nucleotidase